MNKNVTYSINGRIDIEEEAVFASQLIASGVILRTHISKISCVQNSIPSWMSHWRLMTITLRHIESQNIFNTLNRKRSKGGAAYGMPRKASASLFRAVLILSPLILPGVELISKK